MLLPDLPAGPALGLSVTPSNPAPVAASLVSAQSAPRKTRFSVVVVHRNGSAILKRCLRALYAAWDADCDEIFVVDNHSVDDSLSWVETEYSAVRLVRNSRNRGFARACNQGIALASGEFLLIVNNDAFVAPNALRELEAAFRHDPRIGVVGGQLVNPRGEIRRSDREIPTLAHELGLKLLHRRNPHPASGLVDVEGVVGACMAVRFAAVREAGPLDEDFFFYFEDIEWCRRIKAQGWRIVVDSGVRAVHIEGASSRALPAAAKIEMMRSRFLFYRKTLPRAASRFLEYWRLLRLFANVVLNFCFLLLTLGRSHRAARKLSDDTVLARWMLLGRPTTWGFDERCEASGTELIREAASSEPVFAGRVGGSQRSH